MRIVVVGALGAVGGAVALSLSELGHEVIRVSSRIQSDSTVISTSDALDLVRFGSVELLIHAAGPGDHRTDRSSWESVTSSFAAALADSYARGSGVRGVLLSTVRVLEGYETDFLESSPAVTRTAYAQNNARNEALWIEAGGPSALVLRLANFFSSPSSLDSPQAALLPWSLVTEALSTGALGIRSGANFTKEFISGPDIATAVLCIASASASASASAVPSVVATVPGLSVSMGDFAGVVQRAFARAELPVPDVSFGPDSAVAPQCASGWLAQSGWKVGLSLSAIEDAVAMWITSLNS